jgi:acyl dehydratase
MVGRSTTPITRNVDAAWVDAFSEAVADRSPHRHLAHPLFPVCLEWPAVTAAARLDDGALLDDERRRGVHATHDLTIHRLLRPGDVLTTTATIEAIEPRPRGTLEQLRLETHDEAGAPVATTIMGSMFLGVGAAPSRPVASRASGTTRSEPPADAATLTIPIAADQARTYSEASRIWNPIHTEAAAARAVTRR